MHIALDSRRFLKTIALFRQYDGYKKKEASWLKFECLGEHKIRVALYNFTTSIYIYREFVADVQADFKSMFVRLDVFERFPLLGDKLTFIGSEKDGKIESLEIKTDSGTLMISSSLVSFDTWVEPTSEGEYTRLDTFKQATFNQIFTFVAEAAATELTRPVLMLLLYRRQPEQVELFSADGFRLHRAVMGNVLAESSQHLIAAWALAPILKHAKRLGGDVIFGKKGNMLMFEWDVIDLHIWFPEGEGKFPSVDSLVEDKHTYFSEVQHEPFERLLSTVPKWAQHYNNYTLRLKDGAMTTESLTGVLLLPNSVKFYKKRNLFEAVPFEIALNMLYFYKVFKALPKAAKHIMLKAESATASFQIEAEANGVAYTAVIMPMATRI